MDEIEQNRMLKQMLDITQRRIERERLVLRRAAQIHEEAVQHCKQASDEMQHLQSQAPVRRKAHLSELMAPVSAPSLHGIRVGGKAGAPLEAYREHIEALQRELAESVNRFDDADKNRLKQWDGVEQAKTRVRVAEIRREKWIALQDELAQESLKPSFEG